MRELLPGQGLLNTAAALALAVAMVACDRGEPGESGESSASVAADAGATHNASHAANRAARGTPDPNPVAFGKLLTDVDRVVLTERTVLVLDDAGMPTGDQAHPAAYETSDPAWIAAFVDAVGADTSATPLDEACEPWADLTLYRGAEARGSIAVDCGTDRSFATFKTRGQPRAYRGARPAELSALLKQLRNL
jgi:hypothetical protein